MRIRVKEVAFYSIPDVPKVPSWQDPSLPSQSVCEFTLYEFSKCKTVQQRVLQHTFFHSPSWLQDAIEGCMPMVMGQVEGSHVSVFAYLMKGEYDDSL